MKASKQERETENRKRISWVAKYGICGHVGDGRGILTGKGKAGVVARGSSKVWLSFVVINSGGCCQVKNSSVFVGLGRSCSACSTGLI